MRERIRPLVAGAALAAVAPLLVGTVAVAPAHAEIKAISSQESVQATAQVTASKQLNTDYQAQKGPAWCAPAAARHALTAVGKHPSQASLARLLRTHPSNGTNSVKNVKVGLDHYTNGYKAVLTPSDPMPTDVRKRFWLRIKHSIDNGRPVVVNILAYGGSSAAPSHYPNYTIRHYVTISGYDTAGANKVRVVDSAFGKPRYWLEFSKMARLVAQKGYVYY